MSFGRTTFLLGFTALLLAPLAGVKAADPAPAYGYGVRSDLYASPNYNYDNPAYDRVSGTFDAYKYGSRVYDIPPGGFDNPTGAYQFPVRSYRTPTGIYDIPTGTYDYHPLRQSKNRLKPVEVYRFLEEYVGFMDRIERVTHVVESNLQRQNVFNQLDGRQRIEVLEDLRDMQAATGRTRKLLLELNVNDHDHYDLATAQAIDQAFSANRDGLERLELSWLNRSLEFQYMELVNLRREQEQFDRSWYAHMVATSSFVDRLLRENNIDYRQ
jgi:hypothetical protein